MQGSIKLPHDSSMLLRLGGVEAPKRSENSLVLGMSGHQQPSIRTFSTVSHAPSGHHRKMKIAYFQTRLSYPYSVTYRSVVDLGRPVLSQCAAIGLERATGGIACRRSPTCRTPLASPATMRGCALPTGSPEHAAMVVARCPGRWPLRRHYLAHLLPLGIRQVSFLGRTHRNLRCRPLHRQVRLACGAARRSAAGGAGLVRPPPP